MISDRLVLTVALPSDTQGLALRRTRKADADALYAIARALFLGESIFCPRLFPR